MGERHQIRLVRWQQQTEWRGTGINFAETSGQRHPEEDMGDSLEKGTKTVTRSSVAMRTPETIACFTRPQLSGISVNLVQCDQIYESPTLNKTLGTYLNGYNNHRHYIFRVICIRNLLRVQIQWRNTRSSLAPSHGHQLRKHRCGCRVFP